MNKSVFCKGKVSYKKQDLDAIDKLTSWMNANDSLSLRIHCIMENIASYSRFPKCVLCHNTVKWCISRRKFNSTCSPSCNSSYSGCVRSKNVLNKDGWLAKDFYGYKIVDNSNLPKMWGPNSRVRVMLKHSITGHTKKIFQATLTNWKRSPIPTRNFMTKEDKNALTTLLKGANPSTKFDLIIKNLPIGEIRCVCGVGFSPSAFNRFQRFCSKSCQQKDFNQKYRKLHDLSKYHYKNDCADCNNFRRIRKSDGRCKSCINLIKYGRKSVSVVGTCFTCNRQNLTLSAGRCKSCHTHGIYIGTRKVSHGEKLLRLVVADVCNNDTIFNYRPHWLTRTGSNHPMELDVAIPSMKLGFEFDGRPHFDKRHPGHVDTLRNDKAKIDLCILNGWILIKINNMSVVKPSMVKNLINLNFLDYDVMHDSELYDGKYLDVLITKGKT